MLSESLDRFFLSEESNVLVIKGGWGVGKTYAWRNYISNNTEKLSAFKSVAYVSLFGVPDISAVRKGIISGKENLSEDDKSDCWIKKGRKKLNQVLGGEKFDKAITETFKVKAAAEYYYSLIYHSMNNSIVCIDDLERKSDDLKVDQILGLIDELVEIKQCKVVLIFNEDELNKLSDGTKYSQYREKIVDIEIEHNPSIDQVFDVHFQLSDPLVKDNPLIRTTSMSILKQLDMKNIRVLRKIKWVISEFWHLVGPCDFESLKNDFIKNTCFLCWAYYMHKSDEDFNELYAALTGTSKVSFNWKISHSADAENLHKQLLIDKMSKQAVENNTKTHEALVSRLNIGPSIFDKHIVSFIKSGVIVGKSDLVAQMSKRAKLIERELINKELTDIWKLYSDSFEDNFAEFTGKLNDILENHMNKISIVDFDAILDYADHSKVMTHIEQYMYINGTKIDFDEDSTILGRIKNVELKKRIIKQVQDNSEMTIDSVLKSIINGGWKKSEIEFLLTMTVPDIVEWMESSPDDLVKKIRSGWLGFHNNTEIKYQNITFDAIKALKIIAGKSSYNKKRVENIYNIRVDDTDTN